MHRAALFPALIIAALLAACAPEPAAQEPELLEQTSVLRPARIAEEQIVQRQTIYVPIYSHVYHTTEHKAFNLTATLSLRNVDPSRALVLRTVDYYDSAGHLVRSYLDAPAELGPLATVEYVVPEADETGGAGANFLIEWVATEEVSPLLAEAVMISTSGQQGLSFTSRGVVVSER